MNQLLMGIIDDHFMTWFHITLFDKNRATIDYELPFFVVSNDFHMGNLFTMKIIKGQFDHTFECHILEQILNMYIVLDYSMKLSDYSMTLFAFNRHFRE